ncbi:hypothetical protein ACFXAF_21345, partial [Kitasatospora sp. NPDC059463]
WGTLGAPGGGLRGGAPAGAHAPAGRRVVLALGPDAVLRTARQADPGADSPFGPWQQAGD